MTDIVSVSHRYILINKFSFLINVDKGSPKRLRNVEKTDRHGKIEKGIMQFI
jgi:hypothetical protein